MEARGLEALKRVTMLFLELLRAGEGIESEGGTVGMEPSTLHYAMMEGTEEAYSERREEACAERKEEAYSEGRVSGSGVSVIVVRQQSLMVVAALSDQRKALDARGLKSGGREGGLEGEMLRLRDARLWGVASVSSLLEGWSW